MDWNDVKNVSNEPLEGIYFNLVGMTFTKKYPQSLLKHRGTFPDVKVTFQRDPDNKYDSNAIKVLFDKEFVGHVPRDIAESLAKKLDSGMNHTVEITAINVTPGKESNPGATLRVKEL